MTQGANESGVYNIQPNHSNSSFNVYCDMETDGGGWTVLLRRQDGSVDFQVYQDDYAYSFGNLGGEHWLGLENMHLLTNLSGVTAQLRVDLADWEGNTAFAKYNQFSVGEWYSGYTLSVSGYQSASTAGDSLYGHNGQSFSVLHSPIPPPLDCLQFHAWWYYCWSGLGHSVLTGVYYPSGEYDSRSEPSGVIWWTLQNRTFSLRYADMKIRPGGV